jgi:hypothetical protein
MQTTTLPKMDNATGPDYFSLAITALFTLLAIMNVQLIIGLAVGLTTILYNVLRIYNDFLRDGKWRTLFKKKTKE